MVLRSYGSGVGAAEQIVDAQIDRLVYDLYGLTEEERGVVEGGF